MTFTYAIEFINVFRPGDKAWVSGFRLAAGGKKIIRNRPPVQVEIRCGPDPKLEACLRAMNRPADAVVPINPDGSLDFANASTWANLGFFYNKQDAEDYYQKALSAAKKTIDKEVEKLDGVKSRIDKIIEAHGKELSA